MKYITENEEALLIKIKIRLKLAYMLLNSKTNYTI